jgi:hypothetical protein
VWRRVLAFSGEVSQGCESGRGEPTYLLGHYLSNFWIAVPQCIDCDSRREVQVFPVLDVPEVDSFAFYEHWWGAGVGFDHVWSLLVDQSRCGRICGWIGVWELCFSLQFTVS